MISIIIPIYNTKPYLNRCIQSVLNSTFKDFELILIDDGSTDQSPELCRKYCKKDSRVKFISQEHQGVSSARNHGIEESHGEWIVFIDSDDFISQDFLEAIVSTEYFAHDLLLFDLRVVPKKGRLSTGVNHKHTVRFYKREDIPRLIEKLLNMEQLEKKGSTRLPSPCAKAYKRSVINKYRIRFRQDIAIGEDRLFNLEYFLNMESCIYISKTVYFITIRRESVMHGFYPDFLENDFRYQEQLRCMLEEQKIFQRLEKAYYNSVLSNMADVLVRGIFNPYSTRNDIENYRLCQKMQKNEIYMQALKYNLRTGIMPRRVLLFAFSQGCYKMAKFISKESYKILECLGRL